MESVFVLVFVILLLIFFYFIPSFNAYGRRHKNKEAILILNVVAGWTFVGWVIALVWSYKIEERTQNE